MEIPTRKRGASLRRVSFRDSSINSGDEDDMRRLSSGDEENQSVSLRRIDRDLMIVERNSESSTEIMATEEGGLSDQEQTDFNQILRKASMRPGTQQIKPIYYADAKESEEEEEENKKSQKDLELEMRYKSVLHMAKKNLMFELEYIQAVCEHFENGAFPTKQPRRKKASALEADNPFSLLNQSVDDTLDKSMISDDLQSVTTQQTKTSKKGGPDDLEYMNLKRDFLTKTFKSLEKLRRKYLRSDAQEKIAKEVLTQKLLKLASQLEVSRLCLDNYIYPRDMQLNLIDVQIEDDNIALKKKDMHLTERLYTIEYKDFFTAYEKVVQLNQQIHKIMQKDLQQRQKGPKKDAVQVSDVQHQQLLEDDRESVPMVSKDIDVQKIVDHADDTKKHMTMARVVQGGADTQGAMKALKTFYPGIPAFSSLDDIYDSMEFTLQIKVKSLQSKHTDLYMQLMLESGQPFSLMTCFQPKQAADTTLYFLNISVRALLMHNLSLIIKFIDRRQQKFVDGEIATIIDKHPNAVNENKYYVGFTVLPISKIFWIEQLQVGTLYENAKSQIYDPPTNTPIEEKYVQLLDKRAFKRYRNQHLASYFNFAYQYQLDPASKEEVFPKRAVVVKRENFDQHLLMSKVDEKTKLEKYRYNDFKVNFNKLSISDSVKGKSPIVRIEVVLRDDYGVVYDTIYQTFNDGQYSFRQTYESLIHTIDQNKIKLTGEGFFVRIPTKSIDTLKRLYLIFMVQFLVSNKDSKGSKIKATNFMNDLEGLQFRTELVAVMSLYDTQVNCIRQNSQYTVDLMQIRDHKKSLPTRYEHFKQPSLSNLKKCEGEKLKVTLKLISNEFTHNTYINSLLMIKDIDTPEQDLDTILRSLKLIKDTDEQVLFHDKILDKLFKLISDAYCAGMEQSEEICQQIFDSIITMIDLLNIRSVDSKDILENYIQKHFSNSKVYKPLMYQVEVISAKIKEGLLESQESQTRNGTVLMAMKYLGTIFKFIRGSFIEALNQLENSDMERTFSVISQKDLRKSNQTANMSEQSKLTKLKMESIYHKGMIPEEDEDSDDEFMHNLNKRQNTHVRKQAMRQTTKLDGMKYVDRDMSKGEFAMLIQKSLKNIFEGCHKDELKNTLSLRAILYENVSNIFEHVADFMDDSFMQSVFYLIYDEKYAKMAAKIAQANIKDQDEKMKLEANKKPVAAAAIPNGILKKQQVQEDLKKNKTSNRITGARRSEITTVNGQSVTVDNDYLKMDSHIKALNDYSHMNEEGITKLKIIAMGDLLANGIFDKVHGDTNKIVLAFCENIEKFHLKRSELNLHVFYFLYQLFQYLKVQDDLQEFEKAGFGKPKLLVFSKKSLDLRDFFTKIVIDVMQYLKLFLIDNKIEDKIKAARLPEGVLAPFKEKVSLVFMSIINTISKDRLKVIIFNEPKRLILILNQFKELVNKITFQEPYSLYFEKKKTQVFRKIIGYVVQLFMESDPDTLRLEYHQSIYLCRQLIIYLWNKLAKIKLDYQKTTRYQALVKDQLKVHKGKMLDQYIQFWERYKHVGQSWVSISGYMTKQFEQFILLSNQKAIRLVVQMMSDSLTFEFKQTSFISFTTSSVFKVYYHLNHEKNAEKQGDVFAMHFYKAFEHKIMEENELWKTDPLFKTLMIERFEWMKLLSQSLKNVKYSSKFLKTNTFYRAYCLSQLNHILFELKLFKIFQENFLLLESLNNKLSNTCENGYLQLMFAQVMEQQNEQKRKKMGDRLIQAKMQLQGLSGAQKYFQQAQFYQKAIEILNQQKDIAEKQLFDFSKVSQIVRIQLDIYETLSIDQDRHYASHFKVGFFGMSFPEMLRNKEFILRTDFYKKRLEVRELIQSYFPDAFCLDYSNFPDKNVLTQDKQSIQVQAINPFSFVQLKEFDLESTSKDKEEVDIGKYSQDLPPKLKIYYMENFKNKFYKETLLNDSKQRKDGDDFQKDRMIEIYTVKYKFPTIFNLQEIVKTKKIIRNAFDEAIRSVQQLMDLINEIKKKAISTEDMEEFVDLRNKIQFALRSPIQGGVKRFLDLFMTEENLNGPHRDKTLKLFSQLEKCQQVLFDGIQALQSFLQEETIMGEILADYASLKEKIGKIRGYYIDGNA